MLTHSSALMEVISLKIGDILKPDQKAQTDLKGCSGIGRIKIFAVFWLFVVNISLIEI